MNVIGMIGNWRLSSSATGSRIRRVGPSSGFLLTRLCDCPGPRYHAACRVAQGREFDLPTAGRKLGMLRWTVALRAARMASSFWCLSSMADRGFLPKTDAHLARREDELVACAVPPQSPNTSVTRLASSSSVVVVSTSMTRSSRVLVSS